MKVKIDIDTFNIKDLNEDTYKKYNYTSLYRYIISKKCNYDEILYLSKFDLGKKINNYITNKYCIKKYTDKIYYIKAFSFHYHNKHENIIDLLSYNHQNLEMLYKKYDTTSDITNCCEQIKNVLNYIHSNGWYHGDLHMNNIVYDNNNKLIKLIDFELSDNININYLPFVYKIEPKCNIHSLLNILTNDIFKKDIYYLSYFKFKNDIELYRNDNVIKKYSTECSIQNLPINILDIIYDIQYKNAFIHSVILKPDLKIIFISSKYITSMCRYQNIDITDFYYYVNNKKRKAEIDNYKQCFYNELYTKNNNQHITNVIKYI